MLVEKVEKLSSVAQIQSQLALYIDPAQNSKTVTFAMVKQKLRMCKYRYICEVHDDLKVIGKVFYQHSKGKNNQTQLLKIVADFIKNVQFQWAVFLKDIKDKGIDEYQKLKTNKDLTSKIEEMEKLVLEKIVKPKLEACIDK